MRIYRDYKRRALACLLSLGDELRGFGYKGAFQSFRDVVARGRRFAHNSRLHNNNAHKPVLVLGHAAPGDVHRETLQLFHDLALDVGVRSARHLNHDLVRQVHVHLDVVDAAGLLLRIGVDLLTFRAGSDECGIHGHFPQIWTGQVMTCRSVVLLRRVNG